MAIEIKKTKVKMINSIYLGMPVLDISKILTYKFWYDYIKPKYGDRAKLCYTDTDSFVIYIITEDFFKDIAPDVDRWFGTSNYDKIDKRSLSIGKNKKVPDVFKYELGGKIIAEIAALRPKTWANLMDDGSEHKKVKGTKKGVLNADSCLKITKIACLMKKAYSKNNKDLKGIIMICTQKKLIRLR